MSATAELVLAYLRADEGMRAMYRQTMPTTFTEDLVAAIAEADAMLSEADAAARDALDAGAAVYSELDLPTAAGEAASARAAAEVARGGAPSSDGFNSQRSRAREVFQATLAKMIAESLEEDEGDEDDGDGEEDMAGPATAEEALFTVLPLVCELGGAAVAKAASGVSRLFRQAVVHGPNAKALWLGVAMREYNDAARALVAANGAEVVLTQDWRRWVLAQPTEATAAAAVAAEEPPVHGAADAA